MERMRPVDKVFFGFTAVATLLALICIILLWTA